jgi:hypothetical protein
MFLDSQIVENKFILFYVKLFKVVYCKLICIFLSVKISKWDI